MTEHISGLQCPKCDSDGESAHYCRTCGEQLTAPCAREGCIGDVRFNDRFCGVCGTKNPNYRGYVAPVEAVNA